MVATGKCVKIEVIKHYNFNLYKKIKEATGRSRRRGPGIFLDLDNNFIIDKKDGSNT